MTSDNAQKPDYTQRVGPRFMVGTYLAVNAIRDLYMLIEGPDCVHIKTQYVQGNHDLMSTLTSVSGFHRIANTALHPDHMSGSREHPLRERMMEIAGHAEVPALLMTAMPMAFVTGADYDRLAREVSEKTGTPTLVVPGKSLSHDWLDGYAEVLKTLASGITLPHRKLDPNKVAIVGYLFDRNEADHLANIRELERMLSALGLDLVSVWLSGQRFSDLALVAEAGSIISLPYGRRAARILGRRTGARVIDVPLPFGLPATEEWVRHLGRLFDADQKASAFVEEQLTWVIPRLEWVTPFLFQNRYFGYIGDPFLLPGFASFTKVLGARLRFAVVTNRPIHARGLEDLVPSTKLLVYPRARTLVEFMQAFDEAEPVDLLVASDLGMTRPSAASFEIGFPAPNRHALYDRPFLGFSGALALADGLANAMRAHALEDAGRPNHAAPRRHAT